jgi:hypothetical protein
LSEAEIRSRGCLALERGGSPLDGPLRLLGPWASFLHWTVIMWGVFYDL